MCACVGVGVSHCLHLVLPLSNGGRSLVGVELGGWSGVGGWGGVRGWVEMELVGGGVGG